MPAPRVSDEELALDVQAYYDNEGNRSEAARSRGLRRQTYNDRLRVAQQRLGIRLGKVADGRVEAYGPRARRLPRKGHRHFYLLTSIQNNTRLHPGFQNVLAYRDFLDALPKCSAELLVGTYSYQKAAYGAKAVKRGKLDTHAHERLWYAREAEPFIVDESVELAPGLVWCGEQNIMLTARHPLTSFEDYNGRKSNVVPHAKFAMESVASMADEPTKFNYTTGTVTQRNYIQKRAGILAEQKHSYGFALVEVDHEGNWFVRQVTIDEDDAILDVGPRPFRGLYVQAGQVREVDDAVTGIYWGDAHAAEMDMWVRRLCWGKGGMLDTLRPRHQFMGDVFSMRSRSHHEERDFHRTYAKHVDGEESVEDELQLTADFLAEASRDWCETVVVPANHDRHLSRWLNETDFRRDPVNAKLFCLMQYHVLDAMDRGDRDFNPLEWGLVRSGCPPEVRFLGQDESYVVSGVENGLHGDLGPNGSRGSTRSLTKLGRPVNKGHDHTAAIRDQVFSAGTCAVRFPYMKGPGSHSVSHIVTYRNGARTLVTMWAGRWRA